MLPSWKKLRSDNYATYDENDNLLDLGGAECKSPISIEYTNIYLNQFVKRIGKPNIDNLNYWRLELVAGFLDTNDHSIVLGNIYFKYFWHAPLLLIITIAEMFGELWTLATIEQFVQCTLNLPTLKQDVIKIM
jgi:hypothetical protein